MRGAAVLAAVVAALVASLGGYAFMRSIGPGNREVSISETDPTTGKSVVVHGGNQLQSRNFQVTLDALGKFRGPDTRIATLNVSSDNVSAAVIVGSQRLNINYNDKGQVVSQSASSDSGTTPTVPLKRVKAAVMDRMIASAIEQSGVTAGNSAENVNLDGRERQWTINLNSGDARSLIADLDGRHVRLSGEADTPIGASTDSLLRHQNFALVIPALRKQVPGVKAVRSFYIRPDRVDFQVQRNSRILSLSFTYEGQLSSRSLGANTLPPNQPSYALSHLDSHLPERIVATAHKRFKNASLNTVQYIASGQSTNNVTGAVSPEISIYLLGKQTRYVYTKLDGKTITYANHG